MVVNLFSSPFQGTLMELGISPIVTSSLIMQVGGDRMGIGGGDLI